MSKLVGGILYGSDQLFPPIKVDIFMPSALRVAASGSVLVYIVHNGFFRVEANRHLRVVRLHLQYAVYPYSIPPVLIITAVHTDTYLHLNPLVIRPNRQTSKLAQCRVYIISPQCSLYDIGIINVSAIAPIWS